VGGLVARPARATPDGHQFVRERTICRPGVYVLNYLSLCIEFGDLHRRIAFTGDTLRGLGLPLLFSMQGPLSINSKIVPQVDGHVKSNQVKVRP
jgi:hypothetical protein